MSEKTILNIEGMTCNNCALGVTRFLEKKGLKQVHVDFTTGEVVFSEIENSLMPDVVKGINQLGYQVIQKNSENVGEIKSYFFSTLEFRFAICALLTLPLLLHMFIDFHLFHNAYFQLVLSTPVFLIGMVYFGKSAWMSLKTGIPNMDVLVAIGASAAYLYSIAGMLIYNGSANANNYLFFETTSTIITLVMLGNIIEKRSVTKTTTALRELAAMQPATASRINIKNDHTESVTAVSVSEIKKNDLVIINTGDAVPVDGKIYWGKITVDEAALTGESMPVDKENGDNVLAGSIVIAGSAKVMTEKAGTMTVLANIIDLVKKAQQSKPEIQKLGDKISSWFVPAVVIISVLTFFLSYLVFKVTLTDSIMSAIAVLVISCPCAMGLATPTAVAVGLGKAAKAGILVKGGSTLELFSDLKTAVFDKTGTITTGNFKIKNINPVNFPLQDSINILYSIEQHSSHPIALSIVKELENKKTEWLTFEKTEEEKGIGMIALDVSGNRYVLGSLNSLKHPVEHSDHSVYLSKNDQLVATVDLTDEIKPGAADLIKNLRHQGINPVLLSGDNMKRCAEVAGELNISEVYAGQLPHQKSEIILQLKSRGRLMMVGDGVNDAPSLAYADIGISFGEATKIAINSAQVIILNSTDLRVIIKALRIGQMTLTTIKQNLFWAFAYNIIAIPVAAMGMLNPMVAAFSMAFSDVVVIGNSIRLKFRK